MHFKYPKKPKYLYKYQPISPKWSLENLEKRQIWFQKPLDLNDPFDCKNNLVVKLERIEVPELIDILRQEKPNMEAFGGKDKDLAIGMYQKAVLDMSKKLFDSLALKYGNETGVACFSRQKDDLLMWSHYAESHQGYCLEFDTSFDPFTRAFPVKYYPDKPQLNLLEVYKNNKSMIMPLLFSKAKCWRYEEEWRIFNAQGVGPFRIPHGCLVGIYLGAKMTDGNKSQIIQAVNVPNYYVAELDETRFGLVFRKLIK